MIPQLVQALWSAFPTITSVLHALAGLVNVGIAIHRYIRYRRGN